jgi:hypothetical protein
MQLSVTLIPELRVDGLYIMVCWNGGSDVVGPLVPDQQYAAVIDSPDVSPGRVPPSRKIKRLSRRQEEKLAASIGGKRHAGSGAMAGLKGDFRKKGVVRCEAKFTQAKTFTLSRDVLDKIRGEATHGEVPTVVVEFKNKLTGRTEDSWAVIPTQDWEDKIANAADKDR